MKKVKKYTFISVLIFGVGMLLPLINAVLIGNDMLTDVSTFLIVLGFFLTYVFTIIWSSHVSKSRLYIATIVSGLLFMTFLVSSHVNLNEAHKQIYSSQEYSEELREDLRKAESLLYEAETKIESLKLEIQLIQEND